MKLEQLLDITLEISYYLTCFGAETYRINQSVNYIARAYGLKEIHVFAIPSTIIITLEDSTRSVTQLRQVDRHIIDLDKVKKLLNLSRHICTCCPSYSNIMSQMHSIVSQPRYEKHISYIASMLIVFSYTLFSGGSLGDSAIALLIGAVISFIRNIMEKLDTNGFFSNLVCSFIAGSIANICAKLSPLLHADKIVIGGIILLLPGLMLANSIRDFITSDTMTGLARFIDAIFIAGGIALGAVLALSIF